MNRSKQTCYLSYISVVRFSYINSIIYFKTTSNNAKNPSDPIAYPDATSERQFSDIAKSFEKKYGTMVTFKKSGTQKRVRIDDYLDPGDGYDTSDSFIDDSEAIDLFVAPNVSTKFGGFFVCEGTVEGMEDQNIKIDSFWGLKSHSTVSTPSHAMKKAKSKALLDRAVKRLSTPGAVKRKSKDAPTLMPSTQGQENNVNTCALNTMANLDDVFDAVLSASAPVNIDSMTTPNQLRERLEVSESPLANGLVKPSVEINSLPSQQQTQQKPTPLPVDLPNEVRVLVEKIVSMAQPNIDNQRRVVGKAFDGDLLNLSTALNTARVNHTVRSAVFAHTEDRIQWKRKSLTRRLKKLNVASEDEKMNPLLDALGDAVAQVMPSILNVYTRDKETYLERMKVWQAESKPEPTESAESNGPATNANNNTPGAAEAQASKRPPKPGPPKKLFRWNEDCRTIFHAIVKRRLESHVALNVKGTREEYLRGLFPTLVQLWPEGWISHAALWRTALPAFHSFNNITATNTDGSANIASSTTTPPPNSSSTSTASGSAIGRQPSSLNTSTQLQSTPTGASPLLHQQQQPNNNKQQQVEGPLSRRSLPASVNPHHQPGSPLPSSANTPAGSHCKVTQDAGASTTTASSHSPNLAVPLVASTIAPGRSPTTPAAVPVIAAAAMRQASGAGKLDQKAAVVHAPTSAGSGGSTSQFMAAVRVALSCQTPTAPGAAATASAMPATTAVSNSNTGAPAKSSGGSGSGATGTSGYTVRRENHFLYQAVAKAAAIVPGSAAAATGSTKGGTAQTQARQSCAVKPAVAGTSNTSVSTVPTQVKVSRGPATTVPQRISLTQLSAERSAVPAPGAAAAPTSLQPRASHPSPTIAMASTAGTSLAAILSTAQINQVQQRAQALVQLGSSAAATRTGMPTTAGMVQLVPSPTATAAAAGGQQILPPPPPAHQQHYYQIQGHASTSPPATRPSAHQQTLIYQSQHQQPQKRQQVTHQVQQQQQHPQQQQQNLLDIITNNNPNQTNSNLHLAAANTLLQHIRQISPDQRQHYQ